MTTSIKASCPTCGDIRLPSTKFTIRTLRGQNEGEYRFICSCGIVVKQASEHIITVLRDANVKEEVYDLPLELLERPLDGYLAADDIIDLALAFEDGTAFDKITRKYR